MPSAYEIRQDNLRNLIEEFQKKGCTQREFAEKCDLDPAHTSQMKTGHRKMGDEVARRIERALDLDRGWMDRSHAQGEVTGSLYGPQLFLDADVLRVILEDLRATYGDEKMKRSEAVAIAVAEAYAIIMLDRRKTDRIAIKSILAQSIKEGRFQALDEGGNAGQKTREVGDE